MNTRELLLFHLQNTTQAHLPPSLCISVPPSSPLRHFYPCTGIANTLSLFLSALFFKACVGFKLLVWWGGAHIPGYCRREYSWLWLKLCSCNSEDIFLQLSSQGKLRQWYSFNTINCPHCASGTWRLQQLRTQHHLVETYSKWDADENKRNIQSNGPSVRNVRAHVWTQAELVKALCLWLSRDTRTVISDAHETLAEADDDPGGRSSCREQMHHPLATVVPLPTVALWETLDSLRTEDDTLLN